MSVETAPTISPSNSSRTGDNDAREGTPLLIGRSNSIRATVPKITGDSGSPSIRKRPKLRTLAKFASSEWFQSYSDSERRRHALHASHIGAAAFLIRDAVLGDQVEDPAEGAYDPYQSANETDFEKFRNSVALLCRHWCPSAVKPLWTALTLLILLTFLEPPHWCRDDYSLPFAGCENYLWAKGVPATTAAASSTATTENNEVVEYYPNTGSMWLTVGQTHATEALCSVVIAVILLMRLGRDGLSLPIYLRKSSVRINRTLQIVCLLLLWTGMILEHVHSQSKADSYTQFHAYYRLVLLASFLRGTQREMDVVVDMLPSIFKILVLLLILMVFYAWFGVVMFVDTDEGRNMFPSLVEGLWTLWICVTTANYPDVMMPGYNENRWVAIYFISFMTITFFFLMNVILAAVVNEYDTNVQERRQCNTDFSIDSLKKAYQLLTKEEEEKRMEETAALNDSTSSSRSQREQIDKKTVMTLFEILNTDFPEFRYLSDVEEKLLFAVLDRDGSSRISEEEFMDFGTVLMLDFVNAEEYMSFIERYFPAVYESEGWQRFCRFVKAPRFDYVVDIILVLNAVVVGIQSWPELSSQADVLIDEKYWDGSIDTAWEVIETIFTLIYVAEALSKIAVFGWKSYSEKMRNVFDFTITMLAVATSIIVYYPNDYSDSRLIRMVLTARVLRLLRLLTAHESFQLLGKVSAEILPAATGVCGLLFLMMYFFAALGLNLYGGLITRDPENKVSYLILDTDFSDSEYWANNFNDMLSGMNVLFNLLVVNNWMVCEIGFEAATEAKWVRLFFLSFHTMGVILVNNLVIAFVISNFLSQLAIFRENTGAEVVEGEAVIQDRRALFDASQITGTKTSVSGSYFARLRHANSGLSGSNHHHARLRALFTQTSSMGDAPTEGEEWETSERRLAQLGLANSEPKN